eukprot:scaffold3191_cov118-Cylindrotheca_fusiformis.AAC.2
MKGSDGRDLQEESKVECGRTQARKACELLADVLTTGHWMGDQPFDFSSSWLFSTRTGMPGNLILCSPILKLTLKFHCIWTSREDPRFLEAEIETTRTKGGKENPALIGQTLQKSLDEEEHDKTWSYRSIIGKLNFLEKLTRPEIAFATHQAARAQTRKAFLCTIRIGRSDLRSLPDADQAGTWNQETAMEDPSTARSRLGYLIQYACCPILWASKLITEVCLSTTEAEYCSLSKALRQTIPLMNLMPECRARGIVEDSKQPEVFCTALEDNSG